MLHLAVRVTAGPLPLGPLLGPLRLDPLLGPSSSVPSPSDRSDSSLPESAMPEPAQLWSLGIPRLLQGTLERVSVINYIGRSYYDHE